MGGAGLAPPIFGLHFILKSDIAVGQTFLFALKACTLCF